MFTRRLAFVYIKMQILRMAVEISDYLRAKKNHNKQYNMAVFEIKTLKHLSH
jgi:hypothetical protein